MVNDNFQLAFKERKLRKREFPGLTLETLADKMTEVLTETITHEMTRHFGAGKKSGLNGPEAIDRIKAIEEVLRLPPGWLTEKRQRVVPDTTDRQVSTIFSMTSGDDLNPTRVKVYRGGGASVWKRSEAGREEMTVHLQPGEEDGTFVKVQDGSLMPVVAPSQVILFSPFSENRLGVMLLICRQDDEDLLAIRRYDPEGDAYIQPKGVLPPLPAAEWRVLGLATVVKAPDGIFF